jgi:16S rRNA (cytidine1402-2'-O)-methyltransferase
MASSSDSRSAPLASGLYLVGTPIGNLEDITLRALRVLKEVDLIACEDTRQTLKLLNHYGINTRMSSYHEHNERERAPELVAWLKQGKRIAAVSDAGMPAVSDPGFFLVTLAIEQGVPVIPVPGPSALLAALVASGLETDCFRFAGFLPARRGPRRRLLEALADAGVTLVFYEAPHRLRESLEDLVEIFGPERKVVVAREVTKLYEEFLRGSSSEVLKALLEKGEIRGEITLLAGKAEKAEGKPTLSRALVRLRINEIMDKEKLDERAALKKVAKEMGISKSQAYREWQRG